MRAVSLMMICIGTAAIVATVSADQRQFRRLSAGPETTITRTLRFAGDGERMLDVRTINGSIQVTGYDGNDVQLEVRKTVYANSDADRQAAEEDVRLELEDGSPRILAIARDTRTQICGEPNEGTRDWRPRYYEVNFDFTVRVPRNTRLRVCTINGGDVSVTDVAGDFVVNNVNGRITLDGMRGSGTAETVNGPVMATFVESPRTTASFKTINGDVDVTFPRTLSADLSLKTFNGGLWTDFDVETLPQPTSVASRRDGRFVYRSNEFTRVRIGRGGPEIALESFNGDVRVMRAK